ncbi:hypothetical protein EJB05_30121, partial [Eragrostis curvula]
MQHVAPVVVLRPHHRVPQLVIISIRVPQLVIADIRVYKLNFRATVWRRVRDIGDAVFLPAKGLKSNQIYFMKNFKDDDADLCVFDLKSGRQEITRVHQQQDLHLYRKPFCIVPPNAPCGGAGDEGEQGIAGAGSLIWLIEEEVIGHAEGAVREDDDGAEGERGEDEGSDGGEEDDEGGGGDEAAEHLLVGEGAAAGGERRRVGGAEEVEEAPGGEQGEERGEGEWVGEERGGEGERDDGGVVDAEVGEVLAEAGGGLGEGLRPRERGAVDELRPGPRAGERALGGLDEAADEGEGGGWGGCGGVVGGDGGGRGGGRGGGDGGGKDGWGGRGHGDLALCRGGFRGSDLGRASETNGRRREEKKSAGYLQECRWEVNCQREGG